MIYKQAWEGEWIQPVMKGYKVGCCDCGLVHTIDFRIKKGKVQFMAFRNNRSTSQHRRNKKFKKDER